MTEIDRAMNKLVAHSVLDADALGEELARRYPFTGPVRVQLLFRGMNDIYIVTDDVGRWALRAWRGHWRKIDEVVGELAFLNFLREQGFAASYPVPTTSGDWYFTVDAPEARRPLALYEWAPGVKVFDRREPALAHEVGRLFAVMHGLGRDFVSPVDVSLNRGTLPEDMPYLLGLVHDRPDDARDYPEMGLRLQRVIDGIGDLDLPQGACHGDLHPSNIHVTEAGDYTFLDFDGCGHGWFLKDIANYIFGSDFYGFDQVLNDAFLAGYESVRPMTDDEKRLLDFFVLAKTFQLAAGIARNLNFVGRASLRFRGLDWFSEKIRAGMKRHADLIDHYN